MAGNIAIFGKFVLIEKNSSVVIYLAVLFSSEFHIDSFSCGGELGGVATAS